MRLILIGLLCLLCRLAIAVPITNAQGFYVITNPVPPVNVAWSYASGFSGSFNLYYGGASAKYTNRLTGITTTSFGIVFPQVRPAIYYVAVTAADTNGLESAFSNEITVSVVNPPNSPTMQPPVMLIVQNKPSLTDPWQDSAMSWTTSPDATNQFYRLRMVASVPVVSSPVASPALKLMLPPMPKALEDSLKK